MADGMQSPQLGGTQIDDAFTFDAMSPVQIENGSPLSANLGNNNNNNNGKQHSPIRDGVDDNHTKLITYNWENFVIPFNDFGQHVSRHPKQRPQSNPEYRFWTVLQNRWFYVCFCYTI